VDRVPSTAVAPLVRPQSIGGNDLVRKYLQEVPAALRFFAGSPFRLQTFRDKLAEVDSRFGPEHRAAAVRALRPASDGARARLDRFVREGGVAVTTGQQSGFLTGPLYTVYKALSAAVLARHLEERLGRVVLPIFWIASEDHDWPEVNHAYLLNPAGRLRRFELSSRDPRPIPMSERVLEGDLTDLLEEIHQFVGPRPETEQAARGIIDPFTVTGAPVAAAFGDAMRSILAAFDMVTVDAADPVLKELSRPMLRRALEEAGEHERAVKERSNELTAAGFPVQVQIVEGATNVFRNSGRGRERLYRAGSEYAVREQKGVIAADDLVRELESDPAVFSPNVLLRPVIESSVFPTLAYVGGPGELAYFAQAGGLFEAAGIDPPIAVPRFSGLVLEPAIERTLENLHLTLSDLDEPRESLMERMARREFPEEAIRTLSTLRADLVASFDRLAEQVEDVDPTLIGSLGAVRNHLLIGSERADRKIIRAIKRRDALTFERLDRVLDTLRPMGERQDRVLNVLPFLARYGTRFLTEVEAAIEAHWRLPDDV
jgi:bacillithiol biosynthesis cysteine-adding enzyme BshC